MATVVVGCDSNQGNDSKVQNTIVDALKGQGHTVEKLTIGPGYFSRYDWGFTGNPKGKIGVYIIAAGTNSITDSYDNKSGGFDYYYFVIRGDLPVRPHNRTQFETLPIGADADCAGNCAKAKGKTFPQMNAMFKDRLQIVFGVNANEMANELVKAMGGVAQAYSSNADGSGSGTPYEQNISSLLQGEMTFEELVGEICKGIDLMFLCKRSTVVVTDFSTIFAEAKYLRDNHYSSVSDEDIKVWQLEEDSYELNVNNHGFYNTVYVNYNKGTIRESYEDLVHIYGEISMTYDDKNVDKTTAQMKAKSYLAAHLRDFELTVEASTLAEPEIDIGDIVTLDNPKTHRNEIKKAQKQDPEYLFVKGVNTNWEGDSYIQSDLELQFSPTSPQKKEVPTAGTYGTTNNQPNDETNSQSNNTDNQSTDE